MLAARLAFGLNAKLETSRAMARNDVAEARLGREPA
jgi:hypothetical protein